MIWRSLVLEYLWRFYRVCVPDCYLEVCVGPCHSYYCLDGVRNVFCFGVSFFGMGVD